MDNDSRKKFKREQLRKKLNKSRGIPNKETAESIDEDSIFNMINQVNKSLTDNPDMIKKISKSINTVFNNKELMSSLINQVETNINNQDEILETSVEKESLDAVENDSIQ